MLNFENIFFVKPFFIHNKTTTSRKKEKVGSWRMKNDLCHPTFTDKKVKNFAGVLLTKFLVDQIDKNVAIATSK